MVLTLITHIPLKAIRKKLCTMLISKIQVKIYVKYFCSLSDKKSLIIMSGYSGKYISYAVRALRFNHLGEQFAKSMKITKAQALIYFRIIYLLTHTYIVK